MEILPTEWLSEMGMELNPALIYQCQMNPFDHEFTSQSSEPYSSYTSFHLQTPPVQITSQVLEAQKPAKQLKTDNWNQSTPKASSSSSCNLISFGNSSTTPDFSQNLHKNLKCPVKSETETFSQGNINFSSIHSWNSYGTQNDAIESQRVSSATRNQIQAKDHVLAERKRREKLSQRFIALSALLPGLKKLDKASVLWGAIKYIKQLQDQVERLEDQVRKNPVESFVCVKKSRLSQDDDTKSSDEGFENRLIEELPEIEVRVCDDTVLVRVHCGKQNGYIAKIYSEMQRFYLTIINSNVMPFGHATLSISIMAQMDDRVSVTAKDLAKSLRFALEN